MRRERERERERDAGREGRTLELRPESTDRLKTETPVAIPWDWI